MNNTVIPTQIDPIKASAKLDAINEIVLIAYFAESVPKKCTFYFIFKFN